MGIDKVLLTTYSTGMDEKTFQRSVSADLNTLVRLQRERREVCWVCSGTGRDMLGSGCVYCGGFGTIHIERGYEASND